MARSEILELNVGERKHLWVRSGFQGGDPGEDGNVQWVWKSAGAARLACWMGHLH